ncbi:serine-rich adhesin for platelets-like isoform X1 [Watersipora subatra]|uniref:serine-rich adhesin for platelets-like isoform X1 n=1 Tax=Watersipora subatra TaxID=2589382 RepID=UPI00355B98DA
MFGTKRAQPVHKAGALSLPASKGDDMRRFQAVHDSKSEFSKNIKSYNTAINASMNRHLAQALRDAHATIETLNRSQQSTYKTMCKIVQIQRQKVKDTYQLYQQNLRDNTTASHHSLKIKRRDIQGTKLSPIEKIQVANSPPEDRKALETSTVTEEAMHETGTKEPSASTMDGESAMSVSNSGADTLTPAAAQTESQFSSTSAHQQLDDGQNNTSIPDTDTFAKVEGDAPIPSTRPFGDFPSRTTTQKAFFTASLRPTLPPINESAANGSNQVSNTMKSRESLTGKDDEFPVTSFKTTKSTYAGSSKGGYSSMGRRSNSPDSHTVESAQKAMSLRSRIVEIEKQHMKDFLKKQNLTRELKPYEIKDFGNEELEPQEQAPEKSKVNKSIAAERRKLAKLRDEHRKAVLNSENCYHYTQLSNGAFLQGATAYRRKHFLPPSNRAKQERDKILKLEASRVEQNDEKIGEFFTKIDLPAPSEITKKVLQKSESKNVLELSDIQPIVIVEPIEREKSMQPLTEVAKDINYIRQYIRPVDRTDGGIKNSSWDQKY